MRTATSTQVLSVLQWLAIPGGALVWAAAHVLGYGISEARCSVGGGGWGIDLGTWQLVLLGCAGAVFLLAETAAVTVFLRTRGGDFGDGPLDGRDTSPTARLGRLHFFSAAAIVANVLFLVIVGLDGSASVVDTLCRQS